MKISVKFVSPLDAVQIEELKSIIKNSVKPRVRQRAHGMKVKFTEFLN